MLANELQVFCLYVGETGVRVRGSQSVQAGVHEQHHAHLQVCGAPPCGLASDKYGDGSAVAGEVVGCKERRVNRSFGACHIHVHDICLVIFIAWDVQIYCGNITIFVLFHMGDVEHSAHKCHPVGERCSSS